MMNINNSLVLLSALLVLGVEAKSYPFDLPDNFTNAVGTNNSYRAVYDDQVLGINTSDLRTREGQDLGKDNGSTKPNVLFIMTDQQSYDMMSCMGKEGLKTPHLDQLAKKGYHFEKTYAANPVCMPSRFALLTGHQPADYGVKTNIGRYKTPKMMETIATYGLGNIFKKAGYETLYSGKTHLYGTKDVSEYGFKLNDTDPYEGPALYAEKMFPELSKSKDRKPFFLFLSFMNPHDICWRSFMQPDSGDTIKYEALEKLMAYKNSISTAEYQSQIPPFATNSAPISNEISGMIGSGGQSRTWSKEDWDLYTWMYYRLTESVDVLIGRVLLALEKSGLQDNTIIVFTSDHGEMYGHHKMIVKNVMFEEAQRVPLIFVGKGIKQNYADKSTLVCNGTDFLPTICELADIDYPKLLPGVSLKSYLTGKGTNPNRKYIFTESRNSYQVTDGRYKYTLYEIPQNPEILVDLDKDPGELTDVSKEVAYAGIKATLRTELMKNLESRKIKILVKNARVNDDSEDVKMLKKKR